VILTSSVLYVGYNFSVEVAGTKFRPTRVTSDRHADGVIWVWSEHEPGRPTLWELFDAVPYRASVTLYGYDKPGRTVSFTYRTMSWYPFSLDSRAEHEGVAAAEECVRLEGVEYETAGFAAARMLVEAEMMKKVDE
jgi:hypothetical protein